MKNIANNKEQKDKNSNRLNEKPISSLSFHGKAQEFCANATFKNINKTLRRPKPAKHKQTKLSSKSVNTHEKQKQEAMEKWRSS